jgi:hypothetical protein
MSNNTNKPSDSTMISLKHLQHLYPDHISMILPYAAGKTESVKRREAEVEIMMQKMRNAPGLEPRTEVRSIYGRNGFSFQTDPSYHLKAASLRWSPIHDRYMWDHANIIPVSRVMGRSRLWEAMFGEPTGFVTDRFTRPFESRLIGFTKHYIHRHNVKSYWAMDWLTNISVPRINQYDPVNYVEYCEKHLKYDPIRKPEWMDISNLYSVVNPVWWMTSIRDSFKDNLYPIDDVCKWHLAQMFPVKPITKKRII